MPVPPDQIQHVVVLMLENRSFDHLLGGLRGIDGLDGVAPGMRNVGRDGTSVDVHVRDQRITRPDPKHDFASVAGQLAGNEGFLTNYQSKYPELGDESAQVLGYFSDGFLPVTHTLAHTYAVADRWFCSVPAGTWPNRLFALGATSGGKIANRLLVPFPVLYDRPTIMDLLNGDWAVYNDQVPNSALFKSLAKEMLRSRHEPESRFRSLDQFHADAAQGSLPRFAFIEPTYLFSGADDDHPPHDVLDGELLVGRIYLSLRDGPAWDRTLFILVFDEHGGFFDHVQPPADAASPGDGDAGFKFRRLGVRVPAIIVGSRVPPGIWRAEQGYVDHTSIIATVARRWGLPPLTARDAQAADVFSALTLDAPRADDADGRDAIREYVKRRDEEGAFEGLEEAGGPGLLVGLSGREAALAVLASGPPGVDVLAGHLEADAGDPELDDALRMLAGAIVAESETA